MPVTYLETDGFLFQSVDVLVNGLLVTDGLLHEFGPDTGTPPDVHVTLLQSTVMSFSLTEALVDAVELPLTVAVAADEAILDAVLMGMVLTASGDESLADEVTLTVAAAADAGEALAETVDLIAVVSATLVDALVQALSAGIITLTEAVLTGVGSNVGAGVTIVVSDWSGGMSVACRGLVVITLRADQAVLVALANMIVSVVGSAARVLVSCAPTPPEGVVDVDVAARTTASMELTVRRGD